MKIKISILGSTGSIGSNTFKIIDKKKKLFNVILLAANKNYSLICEQIIKYNPKFFIVSDKLVFKKVKNRFKKNRIKILNRFQDLKLKSKIDVTISAIPGLCGLEPTLEIMKSSRKILLANKESIICGWHLIERQAFKNKTKLIPVDSEHFSIFKILENENLNHIKKIYITASGGPFLNYKLSQFKKITPNDALKHPKWSMGKKISIDSSTLMNKILELIEAMKLFKIPNEKLGILIHPNSLVHAIVKFKNGLTKFIYHETSMIIPIANAIFEKNFDITDFHRKKNKKKIDNLIFMDVDYKKFPAIKLKNKIDQFFSTPIIISAANEILVDQFLKKKLPFLAIFKTIMAILRDRNYKKYAIRKPKNIYQIR